THRTFRTDSPSEVEPDAEHRAAWIHEGGWLAEVRAEEIVGRDRLLRGVIEHVQYVEQQLDAGRAAQGQRPRHAQIDERLRRQSARAARFQQNPLVALRQRDLRTRRPWLAAYRLGIGRRH